jgi:hypothetical protein
MDELSPWRGKPVFSALQQIISITGLRRTAATLSRFVHEIFMG